MILAFLVFLIHLVNEKVLRIETVKAFSYTRTFVLDPLWLIPSLKFGGKDVFSLSFKLWRKRTIWLIPFKYSMCPGGHFLFVDFWTARKGGAKKMLLLWVNTQGPYIHPLWQAVPTCSRGGRIITRVCSGHWFSGIWYVVGSRHVVGSVRLDSGSYLVGSHSQGSSSWFPLVI